MDVADNLLNSEIVSLFLLTANALIFNVSSGNRLTSEGSNSDTDFYFIFSFYEM